MDANEDLRVGALELGLDLEPAALTSFAAFLTLLQRAAGSLNLTSVREPRAMVRRHFLESLALAAILEQRALIPPCARVLDLGSGAGFPGLPLKLLRPQIVLYLLEATGKKAAFLAQTVAALQLPDAHVLVGRAEMLAHEPALRASFDLVMARAVAELPVLVELALPFLRLGGTLAAVKGSRANAEREAARAALSLCGGEVVEMVALPGALHLPVVLVRKVAATPERFPRRPGQPASHPLRGRP